jgi:hypothetical protein
VRVGRTFRVILNPDVDLIVEEEEVVEAESKSKRFDPRPLTCAKSESERRT